MWIPERICNIFYHLQDNSNGVNSTEKLGTRPPDYGQSADRKDHLREKMKKILI